MPIDAGSWESISLEHFRRFESTGPVEFRPITLLFGKNSSGKTSLLRAPLLAKQILLEESSDEVPLGGPDADFGEYKDLVHDGLLSRDVEMGFQLNLDSIRYRIGLRRVPEEFRGLLRRSYVHLVLHWNKRSASTQIDLIQISESSDSEPLIIMERRGPSQFSLQLGEQFRPIINQPLAFSLPRFLDLVGEAEGPKADFLLSMDLVIYSVIGQIQEAMRSLVHIRPLRDMPDRSFRSDVRGRPGSIAGVVDTLEKDKGAQKRVSDALEHMGMATSVALVKHAPGFVGIVLTDKLTGREHNIADVGFGVSQVLPILGTLATARPGTTVLIEQPELHLHPDAQGQLADVLFNFARSRELTLVIETHSEHILIRLQRRIAEERIAPDEVAAYFVEDGTVSRAEIDDLGILNSKDLPKGFFEEEWADALELAYAAARRKDT